MLAIDRRMKILELLREEGSAKVNYLSKLFEVSEPTIRQDLESLEKEGFIVREHGGAYLRSLDQQVRSMSLQHMEHIEEKKRIARAAVELIAPGQTVLLDSGSTVTEIAKLITNSSYLTVVTNALNMALILGSSPSITVFVTGGEFKAPTLSLTGPQAAASLEQVHVDVLFLAAGGVDDNLNLTYPGFQDLDVKKAMIEAATKTILVADFSKFGNAALASLGPISLAHSVITDSGIDPSIKKDIEALGVSVIVV